MIELLVGLLDRNLLNFSTFDIEKLRWGVRMDFDFGSCGGVSWLEVDLEGFRGWILPVVIC